MKKLTSLTALFIGILFVLSFTACSSVSEPNTNSQSQEIVGLPSSGEVSVVSDDPSDSTGNKVLVAYYSATGSTERVANYIAAATNGDSLKLVPVNDYTSDDLNYGNPDSRVVYEHDHPEARETPLVQNTVENWDEYDVVFVGYPIWWQIAAWPVDEFVQENDFTGKTVIPFCTSASSGLGDSGKLLEEMADTGNWLEGQRFSSSVSEENVLEWVNGLDLS